MIRSLVDSNAAWLIQSNIARFEQMLNGELTMPQRQAIDRLLAEQHAKLDELGRLAAPQPIAGGPTDVEGI